MAARGKSHFPHPALHTALTVSLSQSPTGAKSSPLRSKVSVQAAPSEVIKILNLLVECCMTSPEQLCRWAQQGASLFPIVLFIRLRLPVGLDARISEKKEIHQCTESNNEQMSHFQEEGDTETLPFSSDWWVVGLSWSVDTYHALPFFPQLFCCMCFKRCSKQPSPGESQNILFYSSGQVNVL